MKIFTNNPNERIIATSMGFDVDSFSQEDLMLLGINGYYVYKLDAGIFTPIKSVVDEKIKVK